MPVTRKCQVLIFASWENFQWAIHIWMPLKVKAKCILTVKHIGCYLRVRVQTNFSWPCAPFFESVMGGCGRVGREIDWKMKINRCVTYEESSHAQVRFDSDSCLISFTSEVTVITVEISWIKPARIYLTDSEVDLLLCFDRSWKYHTRAVWISEQSFAYDYCRLRSLQTNMAFTRLLWLILFVAPSTSLAQCPKNCGCSSQGSPGTPSYKKIVDCSGKLGNLEVAPDIPTDVTHL